VKLLFLTPQLPYPPRQGTALRNWGLIKHLARGHDITLLSFVEADQSTEWPKLHAACRLLAVPAPRRASADRLRTLFSSTADLARRLWSPEFLRALTKLVREVSFDVIQVEGLEMAPYLFPLRRLALRSKRIYDAHNAETLIQLRALAADLRRPARWPAALYSWIQIPRLKHFETQTCRSAEAVTCVSEADAEALRQLMPALNPAIVPNGIDVEKYILLPPHAPSRTAYASPVPMGHPTLVFTGKMDYRPNVDAALWFARDILPRIHAARPEVQFLIVGQKPTASVRELGKQNGIIVTGAVDDARPLIAEAGVYVAPLRMGGGTRFKLLEAMALARPVVSTPLGAEGFRVRSGQELLLADSPSALAEAVLALLADPDRASALGKAGRSFVEKSYDWSVIIPKLEAVYERSRSR
jgi:sugar transferase (PEP-CTERM/EpsH1 system associated)